MRDLGTYKAEAWQPNKDANLQFRKSFWNGEEKSSSSENKAPTIDVTLTNVLKRSLQGNKNGEATKTISTE